MVMGEYETAINANIDAMPELIKKQKPDIWVSRTVYDGLCKELQRTSIEDYKGYKLIVRLNGKKIVSTNNIWG